MGCNLQAYGSIDPKNLIGKEITFGYMSGNGVAAEVHLPKL